MIFPLPRLQPAWVVSETDEAGNRPVSTFLGHLVDRNWKVVCLDSVKCHQVAECDLLFVDLTKIDHTPMRDESIRTALGASIPLLLYGPAAMISNVSHRLGIAPALLTSNQVSHWWGPERMDEELIRNTPKSPITSITLGSHWAVVETKESMGLAAMAHRPDSDTTLATTFDVQSVIGMPLNQIARGLRGPVGLKRTLACAAVNAGIAAPEHASQGDGLLLDKADHEQTSVIVGRFPALQTKRPSAIVLEMSPGPNDLPAEAAPYVIPGADELVITASAWCNGTLSGLLRLATNTPTTLIGPGTPLSPSLHVYGITTLAGFKVIDREAVRSVIAGGGGVKAFKEFGEQVLMSSPK